MPEKIWRLPYTAAQIDASVGKSPIIKNGTWWTWDIGTSSYRDTGVLLGTTGFSNRNLLDNWYFADPIDQRHGYMIPKGAVIYRDSGFTELIGPAAAACEVVEKTAAYAKVRDPAYHQSFYYAAPSAAVRGYCENGYTIDRWYSYECVSVKLLESRVQIIAKSSGSQFVQAIPLEEIEENTLLTLSFLDTDGELTVCTGRAAHNAEHSLYANTDWGWISFRNLPNVPYWQAVFHTTVNKTLVAGKLELGSHQTLAHKEGDTWVLNDPPPNKALELAKCQRYQYATSSYYGAGEVDGAGINIGVNFPCTMRSTPTMQTKTGIRAQMAGYGGNGFYENLTASFRWGSSTSCNILINVPDTSKFVPGYPVTARIDTPLLFDANL
ncbi:hypothetical protein D1159_03905 [Pseudoflavonifractor sp. 524-17]|uniref:hypothetical protein n=1 Tax=Pseudoflavonifractor sp. 524-17 TaxID=2304577 RepID=UPI001379C2D3|nr:hypothetical protein [Pseudoflavonifractor sp. 524-17]NCE63742.1 hypothetical protein [Pseudoflavonifractor sp. 524-17]